MPLPFPTLFRNLTLGCLLLFTAGRAAIGQSTLAELAQRASALKPMPGDRVIVHVYAEPALSDIANVDERGRIMLPRIGGIQADAYTIAELRDTIRTRLSATQKEAIVEVTVQRRVVVTGEVIKPGVYFADLTSTFGEMVAQSGGLKETGHPQKVYLVRGATRTKVPNWQGDLSPASDLHSGDQIVVGRKSWMELNIIPFASLTMSAISLLIYIGEKVKNQ
jgi:protein involved in polysaccharide export with SLBB domain